LFRVRDEPREVPAVERQDQDGVVPPWQLEPLTKEEGRVDAIEKTTVKAEGTIILAFQVAAAVLPFPFCFGGRQRGASKPNEVDGVMARCGPVSTGVPPGATRNWLPREILVQLSGKTFGNRLDDVAAASAHHQSRGRYLPHPQTADDEKPTHPSRVPAHGSPSEHAAAGRTSSPLSKVSSFRGWREPHAAAAAALIGATLSRHRGGGVEVGVTVDARLDVCTPVARSFAA
jgi:hypothetical protein